MGKFVAGDVVIIPFPYTDLSQFKKRPGIVLKDLGNDDYLLAMITTKSYNSPYSLPIHPADFSSGTLPSVSFVRCNRLFEANSRIIIKKAATVSQAFTQKVMATLIDFLNEP